MPMFRISWSSGAREAELLAEQDGGDPAKVNEYSEA